MPIKEFKQKSKEELKKILVDKGEKLREMRFNLATGKIKNAGQLRKLKKEIARILTLLKTKH